MLRASFFLLLLTGSVAATAQTVAPAATTTPLVLATTSRTATDTVQAVHKLFARHRRIGAVLTAGAVAADLVLAGVSAANEDKGNSSGGGGYGIIGNTGPLLHFGFGGFAVIYGVVCAPVMGVGIQQLIAYGPKRETKVLAAYEATGKLPAKYGRPLRKYLR